MASSNPLPSNPRASNLATANPQLNPPAANPQAVILQYNPLAANLQYNPLVVNPQYSPLASPPSHMIVQSASGTLNVVERVDPSTYFVDMEHFKEILGGFKGTPVAGKFFNTEKPHNPLEYFNDIQAMDPKDRAFVEATVWEIAEYLKPAMKFADNKFEETFRAAWIKMATIHARNGGFNAGDLPVPSNERIAKSITPPCPKAAAAKRYELLHEESRELKFLRYKEESMPERFSIATRKLIVARAARMYQGVVTPAVLVVVENDLADRILLEAWDIAEEYKRMLLTDGNYLKKLIWEMMKPEVNRLKRAAAKRAAGDSSEGPPLNRSRQEPSNQQ